MGTALWYNGDSIWDIPSYTSVSDAGRGANIILTFGVSLLVGLMVSRKNKKIDMVEALKGAE